MTPQFALLPMGVDLNLNGACGPSAIHVLNFTAALSSQFTAEPEARIKLRFIPLILRTFQQIDASLI
jgi:hypothetical protein